jgi:hypothetical protein
MLAETKNSFKEGSLVFNFPVDWVVLQIDKHPFYRGGYASLLKCQCPEAENQKLQGQTALDFVAYNSVAGELWLIEVKDERKRPELEPSFTIKDLIQKVLDTLALLFILKNQEQYKADVEPLFAFKKMVFVLHYEESDKQKKSKLFKSIDPKMLVDKFRQKIKIRVGQQTVVPWQVQRTADATT